ncbi:MAG: methyltransferase domain-containing protein [Jatrophihabitantaceae bacterium]
MRVHSCRHLDDLYSPTRAVQADSYRLPFPDDEFDLVFLMSVFRHRARRASSIMQRRSCECGDRRQMRTRDAPRRRCASAADAGAHR